MKPVGILNIQGTYTLMKFYKSHSHGFKLILA